MHRSLSRLVATGAAAAIAVATLYVAAPAMASEPEPTTSTEVEMSFEPWTVDNLAEHGYELRQDPKGFFYGVPAGTPRGSKKGATAPIADSTGISTYGTVTGNCGTSFVSFSSATVIRTGYYIYPSKGQPISHDWGVSEYSSIDFVYSDFSGLAPWGYQSWQASRNVYIQYLPGSTLSAQASGEVLTTLGICSSGIPTASYKP